MGAAPSSHREYLEDAKFSSNEDVKFPPGGFKEHGGPMNGAERRNGEDVKKSSHDPAKEEREKLPHNYHTIMKEADQVSNDNLHSGIYSGIFLKNNRKKYWVDKVSGCNCFFLSARELSITWSEDPRFWQWCSLKETSSEVSIEVAALQNVCWLEVHGTFGEANLTPGTEYEVAYLVRISDPAYGWEAPVVLRLTSSSSATEVQQRRERLLDKPRGRWIELVVGSFTAAPGADGVVQFSMFEYEGGLWKRGLVIKGVVIRPKE